MDDPARTSPPAFGCDVAEPDGEVLVTITGAIDLSTEQELRRCLDAATKPGKPLFIDLTSVTFIDGRGYRAILDAARTLPFRPAATVAARSALVLHVLQALPDPLVRIHMS